MHAGCLQNFSPVFTPEYADATEIKEILVNADSHQEHADHPGRDSGQPF
jgi:hypothetical protein